MNCDDLKVSHNCWDSNPFTFIQIKSIASTTLSVFWNTSSIDCSARKRAKAKSHFITLGTINWHQCIKSWASNATNKTSLAAVCCGGHDVSLLELILYILDFLSIFCGTIIFHGTLSLQIVWLKKYSIFRCLISFIYEKWNVYPLSSQCLSMETKFLGNK